MQTRAGTEVTHGDAFLFVQNGALNGTPPLENVPRKPDESRLRAGLSQGGALVRRRTFYYVAGEQEYARGEEANDLAAGTIATINQALARSAPEVGLQLQTGFFPTINQQLELSGRLDQTQSSRHSLTLRYALTNTRAVNDAFHTDDLADRSSHGSSFVEDNDLNGALTSTLSAKLLNSFTAQIAQRRAVDRTYESSTPGVLIPGVALFGTPYDGNSRRFETHAEANDNLIRQLGAHTLTFGGGVSHIALRAAVRDGFAGLFVFPTLGDLTLGRASFFVRSFAAGPAADGRGSSVLSANGNPDTNFAELRSYAFAQDHWQATHSLALDLGLRYDLNLLPNPLPQHTVNLAPRFGFAWSPTPDWVVRGGFGLFYDRLELATANRIFEFNGARAGQQIVEGPEAAALYRGGGALGAPVGGGALSVYTAARSLANPYSQVASLGLERALPGQWTVKLEGQLVHGLHLGRTANTNLLPPALLTLQNAASLGIASPTPQELGREVFPAARLNPAYDATNQFSTTAGSSYRGATFTVNRQFTDDFQIMAGYTLSRAMDDASYDSEQPQDPYAPGAEQAFSLQDQRHRLVLSGLWLLGPDPDDAVGPNRQRPGALQRALYGFEFAPILTVSSGFRANPLTGQDSNAEHIFPFEARPLGSGPGGTLARNSLMTAAQVNLDFRVLRLVPLGHGHLDVVAESFNLLNHPDPLLLNSAFGPGGTAQPGYGSPIATGDARRIQFSLDFEF